MYPNDLARSLAEVRVAVWQMAKTASPCTYFSCRLSGFFGNVTHPSALQAVQVTGPQVKTPQPGLQETPPFPSGTGGAAKADPQSISAIAIAFLLLTLVLYG